MVTMPLLEGTDGVDKMSKSLGNYIGIEEKPMDIFGKIMSVSDTLMMRYYELLTDEPLQKLKRELNDGTLHPKDAKKRLAKTIIAHYYSEEEADKQEAIFEKAFKRKEFPDTIGLQTLNVTQPTVTGSLAAIADIGMSKSEIRRKVNEGAVEINGEKINDQNLPLSRNKEYKIRIGKRFFRIIIE